MLALGAGGCGDDEEQDPAPASAFSAALETVSGTEPAGVGYGWVDVGALRASGRLRAGLAWASSALGPGGREVGAAPASLARAGIDAARSDALLAVTTSYTLALRVDGQAAPRLESTLEAAGARRVRGPDGWRELDLGGEWTAPLGTPAEDLSSLGARTAFRGDQTVLARSDTARDQFTRVEEPASANPTMAAAGRCLGDVVAARIALNNHTHLPNIGPDILAFGVRPADGGPASEVLCALDTEPAEVEVAERNLREAFAPGRRDRVTDQRLDELVAGSEVERADADGLAIVRLELADAEGARPGVLLRAFDTGSLITYLGQQPPPLAGE